MLVSELIGRIYNLKKYFDVQQVVTEKISLPGNTIAVNSIGLFGTVGLAMIKQHEK